MKLLTNTLIQYITLICNIYYLNDLSTYTAITQKIVSVLDVLQKQIQSKNISDLDLIEMIKFSTVIANKVSSTNEYIIKVWSIAIRKYHNNIPYNDTTM